MKVLKKIYKPLKIWYRVNILKDVRTINAQKWFKDKGDSTLRVEYPLNENSIVFDVGGYRGEWADDIYTRYKSEVHVFEPVQEFADIMRGKFKGNEKIIINQVGLYSEDKEVKISMLDDGSSIFKEGESVEKIKLVDILGYLKDNNVQKIDLLKLNIEGAEFDLLDYLIANDWIKYIENIQVQFHLNIDDASGRRESIRNAFQKTHELTYDYPFIWENWQKLN